MKTKGLTIQEAIQSGLPFKREKWAAYYENPYMHDYSADAILATDWEIKVPEVTITREKFIDAFHSAAGSELISYEKDLLKALLKELGL